MPFTEVLDGTQVIDVVVWSWACGVLAAARTLLVLECDPATRRRLRPCAKSATPGAHPPSSRPIRPHARRCAKPSYRRLSRQGTGYILRAPARSASATDRPRRSGRRVPGLRTGTLPSPASSRAASLKSGRRHRTREESDWKATGERRHQHNLRVSRRLPAFGQPVGAVLEAPHHPAEVGRKNISSLPFWYRFGCVQARSRLLPHPFPTLAPRARSPMVHLCHPRVIYERYSSVARRADDGGPSVTSRPMLRACGARRFWPVRRS